MMKCCHYSIKDYLRFWINTIVTYCRGSGPGFPKIMIVLTNKDKLEAVSVILHLYLERPTIDDHE